MQPKIFQTSVFNSKENGKQSRFNTPQKNQIQMKAFKTSKKKSTKQFEKVHRNLQKSMQERTMIYGTTLPRFEEHSVKEQQNVELEMRRMSLQDKLREKQHNFQIISRTLRQFIQEQNFQGNSEGEKKSRKKSINEKQQQINKKINFILKFVQAFNKAEIRGTSTSTMKIVDQIIENIKLGLNSEKKNNKIIQKQGEKLRPLNKKQKNKRNIVYSKMNLQKNQSNQDQHLERKNKKQKQKIHHLLDVEKLKFKRMEEQIQALNQELYQVKQEGKILQQIYEEYKNLEDEQKYKLIQSLQKIVQSQQEELNYLEQNLR